MSTESAILLELRGLRMELARTNRRLDLLASRTTSRPDRLRTSEAAGLAGVDRGTINRWGREGLLTRHAGPRPWSRDQLDALLEGQPQGAERRGRRRAA